MFTGIVQELGTVLRLHNSGDSAQLLVAADDVVGDAAVGDSIAVNGCCLTVTRLLDDPRGFACDVMGETVARTALGSLRTGAAVNLERPIPVAGRVDGHFVQGHVDAVAEVRSVRMHPHWTEMAIGLTPGVAPYVVEKGSIAVDGVSLTVTSITHETFRVGLIPHTLAVTVLGERRPGDAVNVEVDIIAKYTERLLAAGAHSPYDREG